MEKLLSNKKVKVLYFDFEFTGLHKNTTPISLGIVDDSGLNSFYAEFNDYDETQLDKWLHDNVICHLLFNPIKHNYGELKKEYNGNAVYSVKGDTNYIKKSLVDWLKTFADYDKIILWSDVGYFDGVLFVDLFGHSFNLPDKIDYQFRDLATYIEMCGYDLDTFTREEFVKDFGISGDTHNALYDAKVIRVVHRNLK
jgi:hypothetical protein